MNPPDERASPSAAQARLREWWRNLRWALPPLAMLVVLMLSPLPDQLREGDVASVLAGWGPWAAPAFIGLTALLVAVGFPRLALFPLGGVLFGFLTGTGLTLLGALLGSYAIFGYVRRARRRRPTAVRGRHLAEALQRRGLYTVILLRQLPVPGVVGNLTLGLLPTRHRDFLLGSLIGFLPTALPFAGLGRAVAQADSPARMAQLLLAGVCLMVLYPLLVRALWPDLKALWPTRH